MPASSPSRRQVSSTRAVTPPYSVTRSYTRDTAEPGRDVTLIMLSLNDFFNKDWPHLLSLPRQHSAHPSVKLTEHGHCYVGQTGTWSWRATLQSPRGSLALTSSAAPWTWHRCSSSACPGSWWSAGWNRTRSRWRRHPSHAGGRHRC